MGKIKKLYIIWGVLVILIVAFLCFLGITYKNKANPFKSYEKAMEEATKKYVELNFLYPEEGETLIVDVKDLIAKDLIKRDEKFKENCDGYTEVSFNGVYNYKAYIKCSEYITNNYNK